MLRSRNLIASPFVYILTAIPVIYAALKNKSFNLPILKKTIDPAMLLWIFIAVNAIISTPLILVRTADKEENKSLSGNFFFLVIGVILAAFGIVFAFNKKMANPLAGSECGVLRFVSLGVVTTIVILNNLKSLI